MRDHIVIGGTIVALAVGSEVNVFYGWLIFGLTFMLCGLLIAWRDHQH